MAKVTLDDAWRKLRRAEEHLKALSGSIDLFWQTSRHTFTVSKDIDERSYTFQVIDLSPPEESWGFLIGDCVHNARSSLDYLMTRLVSIVTGEEPASIGWVQFPIYGAPLDDADKRFNGDKGVAKLREYPAFSGYLTRIRELQPYNNANPSIWGQLPVEAFGVAYPVGLVKQPDGTHRTVVSDHAPAVSIVPIALERLSTLDNIDKHRSVLAAWHRLVPHIQTGWSTYKDAHQPFTPPSGYEIQGTSRVIEPLIDRAQVGTIVFRDAIDGTWTPTEVEMHAHFPIEVALGEWQTAYEGVVETLTACLRAVTVVLRLFEPVFETPRRPPLPVTAIGSA